MTRRHELTDEQCALVEGLMPATGEPGGQWKGHRATPGGIFWISHTGARWHELRGRPGSWKTLYGRTSRSQRDGTIARILERLLMRPGGSTGPCGASTRPRSGPVARRQVPAGGEGGW